MAVTVTAADLSTVTACNRKKKMEEKANINAVRKSVFVSKAEMGWSIYLPHEMLNIKQQ